MRKYVECAVLGIFYFYCRLNLSRVRNQHGDTGCAGCRRVEIMVDNTPFSPRNGDQKQRQIWCCQPFASSASAQHRHSTPSSPGRIMLRRSRATPGTVTRTQIGRILHSRSGRCCIRRFFRVIFSLWSPNWVHEHTHTDKSLLIQ